MSLASRAIFKALGLTEAQYGELKRMLPGQKLQAIARYVELTKVNLAEARAVIDAMQAGTIPGGGPAIVGGDSRTVPLSSDQYAELMRMLPGHKIEAIKLCRSMTRLGLAEAKDVVDAMEKGAQPGGGAAVSMSTALGSIHLSDEQNAEIRALLPGNKIEAIKRYRALTTVGLAEAKDVIDAMAAGTSVTAQFPGTPPEVGRISSRLVALLPSGSRPPTPSEAAKIAELVASGALDDAATQIGAGWGVDPDAARRIALGLRPRGKALGWLFFVVALGLVMALLGAVAYLAFSGR
jgi:ribosomal protein L7/L12